LGAPVRLLAHPTCLPAIDSEEPIDATPFDGFVDHVIHPVLRVCAGLADLGRHLRRVGPRGRVEPEAVVSADYGGQSPQAGRIAEGYAVAAAAATAGVPVRIIKHVTDNVDEGAAHVARARVRKPWPGGLRPIGAGKI
jgi:hypothetical protein